MSRLKADIESVWEGKCGGDPENYCPELNMVWLHCDGETDADKENIGTVRYFSPLCMVMASESEHK